MTIAPVQRHFWLFIASVVALAAVTATMLIVNTTAAPAAAPHRQEDLTIQSIGHFGGHLGAVTAFDGDTLFLGMGESLAVVDVSDEARPVLTSSLTLDGSDVSDIVISGTTAYVVNLDGLRVVDISDPTEPAELGVCETPGAAAGLDVVGSTAYGVGMGALVAERTARGKGRDSISDGRPLL